ncbi:MAG: T9SS type A sorting domain-containing protein [Cyclobacteriaceae bacterium]|nr:T9SS type A sorting domain-containing protein [Cyclobacteriaceae bacterium]
MDITRYALDQRNLTRISIHRILFRVTGTLVFIHLLSMNVHGQTVTTMDEYYGNWGDAASWVGGVQPNPLFTNIIGQNITINGYINVGSYGIDQDLTFFENGDSHDIVIEDTLVVYGDVIFGTAAMDLVVNGFLIVFGNMTLNNRVDVRLNGHIIVDGTFEFLGIQGTFEGDGNIYANVINDTGPGEGKIPDAKEKNIDVDLQNDFPDIYDFVVENGQTPLPVEILYFTAEKENGGVNLRWATVNEENFDYFTLERSADGLDFNEIGNISGKAEYTGTIREYNFFDELPLAGYSFYRLKATDVDGFAEYHGIISVRIKSVEEMVQIYPDPVQGDQITIKFAGKNGTPFKLLSFNGHVLQHGTIDQGINEVYFIRKLTPGIYFIRLEKTGLYPTQKIIIR